MYVFFSCIFIINKFFLFIIGEINMTKKFYSTKEVSELLGISIQTIRKILTKKEISYIQLKRKILIEQHEIEKFIEKKRK